MSKSKTIDLSRKRIPITIEIFLYQRQFLQDKAFNVSKWMRRRIDEEIQKEKFNEK